MPEHLPRAPQDGSLLTLVGIVVAAWPFAFAIDGLGWILPGVPLVLSLVIAGALARLALRRVPVAVGVLATVVVQLLTLAAILTLLFGEETGIFGFVPTWGTAELFVAAGEDAANAVWFGVAPLSPDPPLVISLTTLFGLLTILLNTLLAHRWAILAAVTVGVAGATPFIATRAPIDLLWFVAFALFLLVLLRRRPAHESASPRPAPLLLAATVGVAAIAASALFGPSLPLAAQGFGPQAQVILNPTLDLGNDLREQRRYEVISLATDAARAPYLRIATLTNFDGDVWRTDEFDTRALTRGFGDADLPAQYETQSTSIRMQNVSGTWLPVPYAAVSASGLDDTWLAMPANRSIVSGEARAEEQDYTIVAAVADPSREQLQADGVDSTLDPAHFALPQETPESVGQLAREVTAEAETDYDRLLALQSWFRSEFRYSLSTPVEQGFDGSGATAVGTFLDVRAGYCVHFASAFAMMARSLDMPSRIVVGFLPGEPTGEMRGAERLFVVNSGQLHAWPEVYFQKWGWIPFEPTASLGTPTAFSPEAGPDQGESETNPDETVAPTDTPDTDPNAGPEIDQPGDAGALPGPGALPSINLVPLILTIAIALVVLIIPFAVRRVRRERALLRAAQGDHAAAWAELEATLIDLRIAVTDAESPRERGERVRALHPGADPALTALIDAVERASYAASAPPSADLRTPLQQVVQELMKAAEPGDRFSARFTPRSLVPTIGRLPVTGSFYARKA